MLIELRAIRVFNWGGKLNSTRDLRVVTVTLCAALTSQA